MFKEKDLELIEDGERLNKIIEGFIRKKAYKKDAMHILEAGCGRRWPFQLEGINYILTGVDMDKAALDIRKNKLSDLHESIEGDLCSLDLGVDRFDVIYCSYVLEHIENADVVLNNFVKWLKPNGIIIINVPDPDSVHGFITRITPHWFHVFFYRFVEGKKNAGKPGYAPYPTYYNPVISRKGMRSFCNDEDTNVVLEAEYGGAFFRPGKGALKPLIYIIKKIINIISIGFLSSKHSSLLYILSKRVV
ncbi:MAG: class I SAM-dependent methyltransferase [Methylococcaceae bacterium]